MKSANKNVKAFWGTAEGKKTWCSVRFALSPRIWDQAQICINILLLPLKQLVPPNPFSNRYWFNVASLIAQIWRSSCIRCTTSSGRWRTTLQRFCSSSMSRSDLYLFINALVVTQYNELYFRNHSKSSYSYWLFFIEGSMFPCFGKSASRRVMLYIRTISYNDEFLRFSDVLVPYYYITTYSSHLTIIPCFFLPIVWTASFEFITWWLQVGKPVPPEAGYYHGTGWHRTGQYGAPGDSGPSAAAPQLKCRYVGLNSVQALVCGC